MSQTTNINIRMDRQLKKEFEEFCKDVGLSMSTAFTLFAKKTVQENKIPFTISRETPNNETLKAMKEAEEIIEHPENHKQYTNIDNLFQDALSWNTKSSQPPVLKKILNV